MADISRQGDLDVRVTDPTSQKVVHVITDGSTERLAVDAKITGGEVDVSAEMIRYRPKFFHSKAVTALSDTVDTTLADLSFDGQVSFISVNCDKANAQIILEVDSTEVLRIDFADLSSAGIYDLNSATKGVETNIKMLNTNHILVEWRGAPADILTNFKVKGRRIGASAINVIGIILAYREKIV